MPLPEQDLGSGVRGLRSSEPHPRQRFRRIARKLDVVVQQHMRNDRFDFVHRKEPSGAVYRTDVSIDERSEDER
jgi:hypothetical protein